jgi:hypothetical protein
MKRWLVLALALLLVLGVTGCKKAEDEIAEKVAEDILSDGDAKVDIEDGGDSITIETGDGETTILGGGDKLPDGFPRDFPIDDDAKVGTSSTIAANGKVTYYITLVSRGEVNDLYDWYKSEFQSEGWEITSDFKMTLDDGDTAMLAVKKGDREGTLSLDPADGGGSDVGVTLTTDE